MSWEQFQVLAANGIMWVAFACFIIVALRNGISLIQLLIAAWV